MRKYILVFGFLFLICSSGFSQRMIEFNRLFKEPGDSARIAISLSLNAFGYQTKNPNGFGNAVVTLHLFLSKDTEFRLAAAAGANRRSYNDNDITLLKILSPSNVEHYSGMLGLSKQIDIDDNILFGLNVDYTYATKTFGRPVTTDFGIHYVTIGAELTFKSLPLSIGANYNFVKASQAELALSTTESQSFTVWDAYCLIELPKWKRGNWAGKMSVKNKGFAFAISFGPTMIFLKSDISKKLEIQDQFIPGVRLSAKPSFRFKLK